MGHQNAPAIINPKVPPVNVSQQPNSVLLVIQIPPIVANIMPANEGRQIQQ